MWNDINSSPPSDKSKCREKAGASTSSNSLGRKLPHRHQSFHAVPKVPLGGSPYVRAKHAQMMEKDPDRAIALFWAAINEGDRVDSALKDMAILMKRQNRSEEAIEAIKSFRFRCSDQAQEALDNILLDLLKKCGRLDEQIDLLKHKLHLVHQGLVFNGKRTKTARSQGKKFQVSVEKESARLLGNLGWVFMQQLKYTAAEAVYRKALSIEPDINRICNLGVCLVNQGRLEEAKVMLQKVVLTAEALDSMTDSHAKSYEQAKSLLLQLGKSTSSINGVSVSSPLGKESPIFPQAPMDREPIKTTEQLQRVGDHHLHYPSGIFLPTESFGPCVVEDNRVSETCLQAALASSLDRLRSLNSAVMEDSEAIISFQRGLTTRSSNEDLGGMRDNWYSWMDYNGKQDMQEQGLDFTCIRRVVQSTIYDTSCEFEAFKSNSDHCFNSHRFGMGSNMKCQRRLPVFLDMTLPATKQV